MDIGFLQLLRDDIDDDKNDRILIVLNAWMELSYRRKNKKVKMENNSCKSG